MSIFSKLTRKSRRLLRKRIEEKFEELYTRAEEVLKKYNPCTISVIDGKVCCADCKNGRHKLSMSAPNELCCGRCAYHTSNGCIAEKPLTCKLWLCFTAMDTFPECNVELRAIRKEACEWGFHVYRGNKQAHLQASYECT